MANLKAKKEILRKLKKGTGKREERELVKKFQALEGEEIDQMGQDSEKAGAKAVIEVSNEAEKELQSNWDKDLEFLAGAAGNLQKYLQRLRLIGIRSLYDEELPKDHWYHVYVKEGFFGMAFRTPDGRIFARKFKVSYLPKYDRKAVDIFVESIFESLEEARAKRLEKDHGLYIPKKGKLNNRIQTPEGIIR